MWEPSPGTKPGMLGNWLYRLEDKLRLDHDLNMQNISRNIKIYQSYQKHPKHLSKGSSQIIQDHPRSSTTGTFEEYWGINIRIPWNIFKNPSKSLQLQVSRPSSASRDSSPDPGDASAVAKTTSELGTGTTLRWQRPMGRAYTSVESRGKSEKTSSRTKAMAMMWVAAVTVLYNVHLYIM